VQGLGTEDNVHIGRPADYGLSLLAGDAAAHADDEVGFFTAQVLYPAQVGKDFFLRFLAHGTGVEENDVRFFGVLREHDALVFAQDIGHLVRVIFVHLTAEGADEQFALAFGGLALAGGGGG
jgi:hypothetical protein